MAPLNLPALKFEADTSRLFRSMSTESLLSEGSRIRHATHHRDKRSAVVIGGGIHGISAAIALAEAGVRVSLLERNEALLVGTSAATHNRAHRGFHYPRSLRTARECLQGVQYFERIYPEALAHGHENYYAIEHESKISTEDYAAFCDQLNLGYTKSFPDPSILSRDHLASCFLVSEPCFNLAVLKRLLDKRLKDLEVSVLLGAPVQSGIFRNGKHIVTASVADNDVLIEADLVINATYAYTNSILDRCQLSCDRVDYEYHTTEVVVLRSPSGAIPALTVMDGPFMTLLPYAGHDDLLLMYDVVHSVHGRQRGTSYQPPRHRQTNWPAMLEHGRRYFPFIESLEYVRSYWGARPIPIVDLHGARDTKLFAHKSSPGFFSLREGKFVSAPLIAERLVRRLQKEQLL